MGTYLLNYVKDKQAISKAVDYLNKGEIGIFPTDTVYGIGCDMNNIEALKKVYEAKNRDLKKPIIILVSDIDMIKKYVKEITPIHKKLMEFFWPGQLTIIFNKSEFVSDLLTAGLDTIGIRMPNSRLCLELINQFGNPIATSSANISHKLPASSVSELLLNFLNKAKFILDTGKIKDAMPSTIVEVKNNTIYILREGAISAKEIKQKIGGDINVK